MDTPIPALQRHLQMETDFFCFGCGYNLHGQVVTRDERLGFLVCRCPECGQFHPAAMGVSATRPWLARLGVMLAAIWVVALLGIVGFGGFFVGLCTYAHLETYTTYKQTPLNQHANARTMQYRVVQDLTPGITGNDWDDSYEYELSIRWRILATMASIGSVLLGMVCAIAFWHLTRGRQRLTLVLPTAIAAVVFLLWWGNEPIDLIMTWSIDRVARYDVLDTAMMFLGLLIGRPAARAVVKFTVPPKLRQHLQFLWRCDGKTPPDPLPG